MPLRGKQHLQSAARMRMVPEQSQRSCRGRMARGGATSSCCFGQGSPSKGASANTGHQASLPISCIDIIEMCQKPRFLQESGISKHGETTGFQPSSSVSMCRIQKAEAVIIGIWK